MHRRSTLAALALTLVVGVAHAATTCGIAPRAPGVAPLLDAG